MNIYWQPTYKLKMNIIDEEHIPTNQTENQIKGSAYENQILDLIRREKQAYLWHQTPETILIENGIIGSHNAARLKRKEARTNKEANSEEENPLRDTGIDIIRMENETECSLVQCKNGYKHGVSMHDLGGFMCWMAMMPDKQGYVYYTDKLSVNVRTLPIQNRIQFMQVPFDTSYLPSTNTVQDLPETPESQSPIDQTHLFTPDPAKLEYQIKARDLALEYYRDQDNGVLAMPCGTGKTYTAFLIAQNFKYIVILSPLREFAKQNLDRFVEYGFPRTNTLLVDSDGCRDVARILEFITGHSSSGLLLSATYDSADVISSVLDAFPNPQQTLFIGDEFHNLSAANINNESDPMNKILVADGFKKLFMSATPRIFELESEGETGDYVLGQTFYDMSFKYAIDRGFITDYRIWLPSIHEDISDLRVDIAKELDLKAVLGSDNNIYSKAIYLFSCLVNTGVQKCIIYCIDTNEIRDLMETMTRLNTYYCLDLHMDKITSANSASSRTQILTGFATSQKIELLFSVRILDECIDIPSCDSIFITYPTKSKIRTIQRLMRCTRTLRTNKHKVGQVFIWCSEYDSILDTLGGIKEIDSSFAEKVMINEVGQFRERGTSGARTVINDDTSSVKKLIIGVKEYRMVSWFEKLELLKAYLDTNKKRPNTRDKDPKIKTLGQWVQNQTTNYSKKAQIMSDPTIYSAWDEFTSSPVYSEYFIDNYTIWNNTLSELKTYLDTNKKRPSNISKDPKIKTLGKWVSHQTTNYSKKAYIMSDPIIYSAWNEFTSSPQYSEYFLDNNTAWNNTLSELKTYLDTNKKRPNTRDKDPKIKALGKWIQTQTTNYSKKAQIMSDPTIYSAWELFISSPVYSEYFIDNNTAWNNSLSELKTYLDTNKKRPIQQSKDPKIKTLGKWVSHQTTNYSKKAQIMSDPTIYSAWNDFISSPQYSEYFLDNNTAWNNTLSELKTYLDTNKKRPIQQSKDQKIKALGLWIQTQTANYSKKAYIMSDPIIYSAWNDFISSPQYSEYFIDNNTAWNNSLSELKTYLDADKKKPSTVDKDPKIKTLGKWVSHQTTNYSKKAYIMSDPIIYSAWELFISSPQYSEYFIDNNTAWNNSLSELKTYLDTNKKRPIQQSKDQKIKALGKWIQTQTTNYSKKAYIMSDPIIYSAWELFITSPVYSEYFIDNNTAWNNTLVELKTYLDTNKKRPSSTSKDPKIKTLGKWIQTQIQNYKKQINSMIDTDIRAEWQKFITSEQYKQYFKNE